MRLLFMGTPSFAVPVLDTLVRRGHDIAGVYTLPDKPAGSGRMLCQPPVKEYAVKRGLRVFQPGTLKNAEHQREIRALDPEAIVVAAYGRLLPKEVLDVPPLGCMNVHPSLLPRHRGPSPVAAAILEGDERTGVTIMLMDEDMDTGPVLAQQEGSIENEDDAQSLTARLFDEGAHLLAETLPLWAEGAIRPTPQDESRATVSRKLTKEDGLLDWRKSAVRLWREVRAYHPWPGSHTFWRGRRLKVAAASPCSEVVSAEHGMVVALSDGSLGVATRQGVLATTRLQLEGRNVQSGAEFLRGYSAIIGSVLG